MLIIKESSLKTTTKKDIMIKPVKSQNDLFKITKLSDLKFQKTIFYQKLQF